MSAHVTLFSSYPVTAAELAIAIQEIGGKASPPQEGWDVIGSLERGKRYIIIYGRAFPDVPEKIWQSCIEEMGTQLAEEMAKNLGGKPHARFMLQLGYTPKSGLLVVELAYQCALCWPCVVRAEMYEHGNFFWKIYTKEDMERLLAEGKAFTTYGMDLEEDEDDNEE